MTREPAASNALPSSSLQIRRRLQAPLSRAEKLELVGLALLAVLPLLPCLVLLLVKGVPRYTLGADFALMARDTAHVWSGDTFVGLASRWGWHHPGPALYYLSAPFELFCKPSHTALYLGTWCLSAFSAAMPVVAIRWYVGRPHAIGVLIVVLAWLAAFGNLGANPWTRTAVVLPLIAFFVAMALFARGESGALLPGAVLGLVGVQIHLSPTPMVGAIGVGAAIAFLIVARRRGGITRKEWVRIAITVGVVCLLMAPMLYEELRAPRGEGNMSKLVAFARQRTEPLRPWSNAFKNWVLATSWFPDRLLEKTLLHEGALVQVFRWEPVPIGISRTARAIVGAEVVLMSAASIVALRRRDVASLVLLALGVLGSVLAMRGLREIVGEEHYSLVFWAIVPATVGWMGIFTTFSAALSARVAGWHERSPRALRALFATGLGVVVIVSTIFNWSWVARSPRAPGSVPEPQAAAMRALFEKIEERTVKEDAAVAIHLYGAWPIATAAVLELERSGLDVRIPDEDVWSYVNAKRVDGAPRVLHVYFDTPQDPLPIRSCLELLAEHDSMRAFVGSAAVTRCASP